MSSGSVVWLAGELGREVIAEGWRWTGSLSRRLSTRISSVWTPADETEVAGAERMATWQPKSLKSCGRRDSLGVEGRLVGGWMLMLGICISPTSGF